MGYVWSAHQSLSLCLSRLGLPLKQVATKIPHDAELAPVHPTGD